MTPHPIGAPPHPRPLRLWPGVFAAVSMLLVRFGATAAAPGFEGFRVALAGGFFGTLAIVVWWVFFSRAPRAERWGATLLMFVALAVTWRANHESMRLMWCVYYGAPIVSLALVASSLATRRLAGGPRRAGMAATLVLASGAWTLVRMDGLNGDHVFQFRWRWSATREERLLAQGSDGLAPPERVAAGSVTAGLPADADWPGFRGVRRDGAVRGVRIETDWSATPPIELWRRPIGPGWSSFAVRGERLFTQEQRGDDEVVACYDTLTGEPQWRHSDTARFFESMGGPGPRATPALDGERLYALGATGILNALAAEDGTLAWSRNVVSDAKAEVPVWGCAGSPLVAGDVVIVAVGGQLLAYDLTRGELRWAGSDGGPSYSSPQRVSLAGVSQILLLCDAGARSVLASDGTPLWEHPWPGQSLVQPALTANGDLLISAGEGKGIRRIAVARADSTWSVEKRWESNRLKPNFNDFVVHGEHVFGFDGSRLACVDLERGERQWKGGRYGHGQLVLLRDQDVLLVLSEEGELALVAATPEHYRELARFPAIEGKTWNHPVLAGDLLLVRNGQEMAAFRLPLQDG